MSTLVRMRAVTKTAELSPDARYRYTLTRVWDDSGPLMVWVLLNPSTADAETDDATVRRCVGFAERDGCGGIIMVNLFAHRATQPAMLEEAAYGRGGIVGPENRLFVQGAVSAPNVRRIVCAWGNNVSAPLLREPARRMAEAVVEAVPPGRPLVCLGRTRQGHPRHPVRLPYATPFEPYGGWPA